MSFCSFTKLWRNCFAKCTVCFAFSKSTPVSKASCTEGKEAVQDMLFYAQKPSSSQGQDSEMVQDLLLDVPLAHCSLSDSEVAMVIDCEQQGGDVDMLDMPTLTKILSTVQICTASVHY